MYLVILIVKEKVKSVANIHRKTKETQKYIAFRSIIPKNIKYRYFMFFGITDLKLNKNKNTLVF